jgi:nitroreductase
MEVIQAIKTRRSIRQFLDKPVSDDIIKQVVGAGLHAPCSKGVIPWYFVVLKGADKNKIAEIMKESAKEYDAGPMDPVKAVPHEGIDSKIRVTTNASAAIIESAPVLILVFNKAPFTQSREVLINALKKNSSMHDCRFILATREVEVEGISASIQSIMLAAVDAGLATVWLSDVLPAGKEAQELFGIKYDLLAGIAMGYAAYNPPEKKVDWTNVRFVENDDKRR